MEVGQREQFTVVAAGCGLLLRASVIGLGVHPSSAKLNTAPTTARRSSFAQVHATSLQAIERWNHGFTPPLCSLWSSIDGSIAYLNARHIHPESLSAKPELGCTHHKNRQAHLDRVWWQVSRMLDIGNASSLFISQIFSRRYPRPARSLALTFHLPFNPRLYRDRVRSHWFSRQIHRKSIRYGNMTSDGAGLRLTFWGSSNGMYGYCTFPGGNGEAPSQGYWRPRSCHVYGTHLHCAPWTPDAYISLRKWTFGTPPRLRRVLGILTLSTI